MSSSSWPVSDSPHSRIHSQISEAAAKPYLSTRRRDNLSCSTRRSCFIDLLWFFVSSIVYRLGCFSHPRQRLQADSFLKREIAAINSVKQLLPLFDVKLQMVVGVFVLVLPSAIYPWFEFFLSAPLVKGLLKQLFFSLQSTAASTLAALAQTKLSFVPSLLSVNSSFLPKAVRPSSC